MTARKPRSQSWESFVDRQVREAMDAGAFDDLSGRGKPLEGLDAPSDDLWWVRKLAAREGLPAESPALQLKLEVERELEAVGKLADEDAVRARVSALNAKIARANALSVAGAPTSVGPANLERVVAYWRARRSTSEDGAAVLRREDRERPPTPSD